MDVEAIKAELRAEMEAAWGKPVSGPGKAPVEAAEKAQAVEEARARKDHFGMVKARNTAAKIWGPFYDAPPAD